VVSYTVLVGFGDHRVGDPYLPGEQRRTAVAAWLAAAAPDVVGFQEMNGYTDARLRREAAAWGHAHAVVLNEDGYPVALTSRWPIEVIARLRDELHHGFLHARSAGVDYLVVHVVPAPGVERKVRELQPVLAAYRAAIEAGRPIVLLGDFNSIAAADVDLFSEAALARYRRWKYALDGDRPAETAVDLIPAVGAVDVWQRHRPDGVELPLPRIDFVFASPDLAATSLGCRWLAGATQLRWSDHPAVVADFAGR
jgi:exodeoxyribonuclease-3